jgi:nucleoside-diphosphate-sugar epimerase
MKNILITGSLGYIGSLLTEYLTERGYKVTGLDMGFFANGVLYSPKITSTVFRDVRELDESDFQGIDAVIHLAGISNDPVGKLEPSLIYDPTRLYAINIAKICKKRGIKFIFASSCSVYGKGEDELLTEESPTYPQTFYSLNKLEVEKDLQLISDSNFSPIALRFATIFGLSPRIRFDVVINMLTGMGATDSNLVLNSDGESWRPNLHILDACKAIEASISINYNEGKLLIINVGDEKNNLKVIEIARTITRVMPLCKIQFLSENPLLDKEGLIGDKKIKDGSDTRTYKVSFEKIKKVFPNFKCDWSIESGIEDMVHCFKDLKMTNEFFKKREFYRLQQLEFLHSRGYVSDQLELLTPWNINE